MYTYTIGWTCISKDICVATVKRMGEKFKLLHENNHDLGKTLCNTKIIHRYANKTCLGIYIYSILII